ncbi:hypothetical protein CAEBREN_23696 [Caenorhabditis brenneri]|uniref:Uncharacterized protein n=1 Tax=Caenorhabditis brenneri TaxID=135651 RepID=G0N057_CAEBE|nr:hypothetical protein CAEBREN_23696 [Caenorhabditis brenneri]
MSSSSTTLVSCVFCGVQMVPSNNNNNNNNNNEGYYCIRCLTNTQREPDSPPPRPKTPNKQKTFSEQRRRCPCQKCSGGAGSSSGADQQDGGMLCEFMKDLKLN